MKNNFIDQEQLQKNLDKAMLQITLELKNENESIKKRLIIFLHTFKQK